MDSLCVTSQRSTNIIFTKVFKQPINIVWAEVSNYQGWLERLGEYKNVKVLANTKSLSLGANVFYEDSFANRRGFEISQLEETPSKKQVHFNTTDSYHDLAYSERYIFYENSLENSTLLTYVLYFTTDLSDVNNKVLSQIKKEKKQLIKMNQKYLNDLGKYHYKHFESCRVAMERHELWKLLVDPCSLKAFKSLFINELNCSTDEVVRLNSVLTCSIKNSDIDTTLCLKVIEYDCNEKNDLWKISFKIDNKREDTDENGKFQMQNVNESLSSIPEENEDFYIPKQIVTFEVLSIAPSCTFIVFSHLFKCHIRPNEERYLNQMKRTFFKELSKVKKS